MGSQPVMSNPPNDPSAFNHFRAHVLGDEALQLELSRIDEPERFAERSVSIATALGSQLSREAMLASLGGEPLGLARWFPPPANAVEWPSKHWLPAHLSSGLGGAVTVDWVHFAGERLVAPFFEESLRRASSRPFNRMFSYRTTLDDFLATAKPEEALVPDGFIFHMSRCGSTLVAQMLAALPSNIVVSEAAPLNAAVQLSGSLPHLSPDRHVRVLTAMVAALGRRRLGAEWHYVIKLDSWHTLALPLFRRAFPQVPWVFVYRDPVEVLVSQMRERGLQLIPGALSPCPFGIEHGIRMRDEEYCARALEKICTAAFDNFGFGRGLAINYDELPDAVWQKILPHFGIACSEEEKAAMRLATRRDAKAPFVEFVSDTKVKQQQATEVVRAAARQHLDKVYGALEALR
jgi:hypothetical protein